MKDYKLTETNVYAAGNNCMSKRFNFTDKDGYGRNFSIALWPTANCQFFSIQSCEEILQNVLEEDVPDFIRDLKARFIPYDQKMVLVDVKQFYGNKLRRIFKDNFKFINDYISTNNSEMVMALIMLY